MRTRFYNLKRFSPVRGVDAAGKYEFEEPKDYTSTFRNAIQYISSRQGGTLRVPDGDYVVGTLDGVRRDPNYQAITLTSGLNIVGAGSNASVANSNPSVAFQPDAHSLALPESVDIPHRRLYEPSYRQRPRADGQFFTNGRGKTRLDGHLR
ncbi:MAG: hypothetical protein R2682_14425 [Pyrinomonadaceae bacterium]